MDINENGRICVICNHVHAGTSVRVYLNEPYKGRRCLVLEEEDIDKILSKDDLPTSFKPTKRFAYYNRDIIGKPRKKPHQQYYNRTIIWLSLKTLDTVPPEDWTWNK